MPATPIDQAHQPSHLAQLFANLPEAFVLADQQRRIVHMNPAAIQLFGHPLQSVLGKRTEVLYAHSGDYEEQGSKRYNDNGQATADPYRITYRKADGTEFAAQTIGAPIRDFDGSVIGYLGIIQDLSERHDHISAMHRLHEITSDRSLDFEARMRAILALGAEHFGLPMAIQSRIEDDVYTVERCVVPGGALEPGVTFELKNTYCEMVLAADGPVGFHHMGDSEAKTHPCYQAFQLEAYIGAPILVDGERYGTLNFSRPEPTRPLTVHDLEMVGLLAQWAGHEIARNRDLRELERVRAELARAAITDGLTGSYNRAHADTVLAAEQVRAERYRHGLAVVLFDLDHFKSINDGHGHAAGDQVLRTFVEVAQSCLRECDVLARWGGEEFLAVLPETDLAGAQRVAERIRIAFAETELESAGVRIDATTSAGVAVLDDGEHYDHVVNRADHALYAAKAQGRDRVHTAVAA